MTASDANTTQPPRKWRLPVFLAAILVFLLALIMATIFEDNLSKFLLNPRTPFLTVEPPPAPDYRLTESWAIRPDEQQSKGIANIFYIHGAAYMKRRRWNAPINDELLQQSVAQDAAPNQVGPFQRYGEIYAPYYRTAAVYTNFTHKYDGLAARQLALKDVEEAFAAFLDAADDPERPIILVGYAQGALHGQALLQKLTEEKHPALKRIAVAYLLDIPVPQQLFNAMPSLHPCRNRQDTRCIISFIAREQNREHDIFRMRQRAIMRDENGEYKSITPADPLCINPLSWTIDDAYHGPEHHLGAASATGLLLSETPSPISNTVGAKCDKGVLLVDRPKQEFLRQPRWFTAKWKTPHYNLFYHDLTADGLRRTKIAERRLKEEARILQPIADFVDIDDSPVNKVPE